MEALARQPRLSRLPKQKLRPDVMGAKQKVTHHCLVQLGQRFNLAWSRQELLWWLVRGTPIFRMPNGTVTAIRVAPKILVLLVVKEGVVVTALTPEMAFADCPRAVFSNLVREGQLQAALSLRTRYHAKRLTKALGDLHVSYHRDDDIVWNAFKWCEHGGQ